MKIKDELRTLAILVPLLIFVLIFMKGIPQPVVIEYATLIWDNPLTGDLIGWHVLLLALPCVYVMFFIEADMHDKVLGTFAMIFYILLFPVLKTFLIILATVSLINIRAKCNESMPPFWLKFFWLAKYYCLVSIFSIMISQLTF